MREITTQAELDKVKNTDEWVRVTSGYFTARGSAHVEAWGSAHVEAWGSAHVVAWGSAHVEAWGSAHVVARGSAHVKARGSAHVEAWDFSSVVQLSPNIILKKGSKSTVIKPSYPQNPLEWSKIKGSKIKNKRIYLYKVLRLNGRDWHSNSLDYLTGKEIVAPDWNDDYSEECGKALHLADSPEGAKYFLQDRENYILCEVSASLVDCRCFPGRPQYPMKLRARACRVERIIEKVENGKKIDI